MRFTYLRLSPKSENADGIGSIKYSLNEAGQRAASRAVFSAFEAIRSPRIVEELLIAEVHETTLASSPADIDHFPPLLDDENSNPAFIAVQPELRVGERLLWCFQSIPKRRAAGSTIGGIAVGLTFAIGPGWMLYDAILKHVGQPGFYPEAWLLVPFFLLFIVIGIGIAVALILAARSPIPTYFAVTTWRAIIIDGGNSRKVQSFLPQHMTYLNLKIRPSGIGDITFAEEERDSDSGGTKQIGFMDVPNSNDVFHMMQTVFGATRSERTH